MKEIEFKEFWDAYGLKRDKIAAERAWKRLGKRDRRAALDGIRAYREDCEKNGRMMMYAQGYINHRRWEDEMDSLTPNPSPVGEGKSEELRVKSEESASAVGSEEQTAMEAFRAALRTKKPAKPERRTEFLAQVVERLCIVPAMVGNGCIGMGLRAADGGRPERIQVYMIDFYDSYSDFYTLLARYFDPNRITFDV